MHLRSISMLVLALLGALASSAPAAHAAALAPARQQVLRVAIGAIGERGSLDPGAVSSVDSVNRIRPLLEPLYDTHPSGRLVPRLAAGQPIVSADRRRITVRLRAARWSDGRRVSPADVALALTRARQLDNYYASFTSSIRRVRTPNASTIVLELRRRDPVIVPMLATHLFSPVPSHVIRRAGARWTNPGTMVSSGAFVLRSRTQTRYVMVRNPRFFGARSVRLQRLELVSSGISAVRTGLRRGTIDITLQNILPARHGAGSQVRVSSVAGTMSQVAYLNTRNSGLSDARARRGIALAIDRARIARITGGTVATTFAPSMMPAPAGSVPESGLLGADGAPSVDASRALLEQASWPSGRTLSIAFASDSTNAGATARAIRDSLAAVGVSSSLRPMPSSTLFTVGNGISPVRSSIDVVLMGWIADYQDRWNFYQLATCSSIKAGLNPANHCSADYDAVADLNSSRFGAARGPWFAQLETLLTGPEGLMPAVPLYEPRDTVVHRRWVRRPTPTRDGIMHFERMAIERH